MEPMITVLKLVLALLAAGTMGFAIQRGATCTVAAVEEIVNQRSGRKLLAMLEAALWVAVGLGLAQRLHWLASLPSGYPLTMWTLPGAVLLGFGAWVNKACVFGAVARLGSGEWAYAATPLGYYFGCLSVEAVFPAAAPPGLSSDMLMSLAASGALVPWLALIGWRCHGLLRARGRTPVATATRIARAAVWSPHGATVIIGLMFLATIVLAGTWAYTDVLAGLAHGMTKALHTGAAMAAALVAGAMIGGYTAGCMRWHGVPAIAVVRCLAGGILMAWGSLLIPGGNDGLILIGMPLLWPYAWAAFLTMGLTVAVAQTTRAFIVRRTVQ